MKVILTRDSVCAGDDIDAPHKNEIEVHESVSISEFAQEISNMGYLANISGGKATWSLAASSALAVIAQQWAEPKLIAWTNPTLGELAAGNPELKLHCSYYAQENPDTTYEILRRFKLSAT